jgi:hypothetical protein
LSAFFLFTLFWNQLFTAAQRTIPIRKGFPKYGCDGTTRTVNPYIPFSGADHVPE